MKSGLTSFGALFMMPGIMLFDGGFLPPIAAPSSTPLPRRKGVLLYRTPE
jgi:hypothetical protein